jgi:hypothetical protein
VNEDEQVHDHEREDVRVPGRDGHDRDEESPGPRPGATLAVEQEEGEERERDAEGEVEHAHRHEPVVDERPGEGRRDEHPLAAARELEDEPRKDEGVRGEDHHDEEPRGELGPDHLADEEQPGEEGGVRLEEAVEDELRVVLGVLQDRDRRQVVRQILQRRRVGQRERPGAEHEEQGARAHGGLRVAHARDPAGQSAGERRTAEVVVRRARDRFRGHSR